MDKVNGKLTVFFEEPFWVGIFERIEDGKLSAAKVTFGAEPKDYEVQEYIQKCYFSLKFSPVVETVVKDIKRNPKRMQREAKKQMLEIGIGTKSQQALKLQQEQNKQERKEKSRKKKEAEEQRMFELKQRKKRGKSSNMSTGQQKSPHFQRGLSGSCKNNKCIKNQDFLYLLGHSF